MKSFDHEDYEEASNYIQNLRNKVKDYPKADMQIFDSNFFNIYRRLMFIQALRFIKVKFHQNNLSESKIC